MTCAELRESAKHHETKGALHTASQLRQAADDLAEARRLLKPLTRLLQDTENESDRYLMEFDLTAGFVREIDAFVNRTGG